MEKEKLITPTPPPPMYDTDLKVMATRLRKLVTLIGEAEPLIPFEQVITKAPQWWIKPNSVRAQTSKNRCVRIVWDTPAQKLFKKRLLDVYGEYREAYMQANGGQNYEEEYAELKARFETKVTGQLKALANQHHVELPHFTQIYQHLQTELEKQGSFEALRTEAVVVPEPILIEYLKTVRGRDFKARSQFPYCTFCRWIGHHRNDCKAYQNAPICTFCHRKGHELNKCYKAPICEHCLEKGHTDKECLNGPRCRFCRTEGHLVTACEKLKKLQCHRCGQHGHTAARCVSDITFNTK